jgi:hypothetical protein
VTRPAAHRASPPAASEVSALIAWMRRLSDAGVHRADPAELAAFQHAKQDLLARIEHGNHAPAAPPQDQPGESVD